MTPYAWNVLCHPLPAGNILGRLVWDGEPIEAVADSVRKLLALLSRRVRHDVPPPPLRNPALRILSVEFRPAWRETSGHFVSPAPVPVPIPAVCGTAPSSAILCLLPTLGLTVHCERPHQVDAMIEHLARTRLQEASPPALHRLLLPGTPWLESFDWRPPKEREPKPSKRDPVREAPSLAAVAERLPEVGRAARTLSAFPGAVFGRDAEIEALAGILSSPRGSVLVVGEPGSGRTCVLGEAARRANERTAPKSAFGGRGFWKTAAHRLISGARWLGDWQEICEKIAGELSRLGDTLWIEDIAALLQAGGDGPEDSVAAFLAPSLDRGDIRLVGEITPRALEALRPRLPAFFDRLELWPLPALEHSESLAVLEKAAALAERDHGVTFERAALESAVRLSRRHIPHEAFPGKALRLLGTCFPEALSRKRRRVDADDVLLAVIEKTGLPDILLRDDLPLRTHDLRETFAARIVGQPEAVDRMARVVQLFKSGLNDPGRPIATLLFAGPTGVGKTAGARALASYVYGAGQKLDPLVRVDMSELQDAGQIARFVGGGADPGGLLTRVRERPFSVVLFDEIEKAHPAFFDALLAVLDEGILADAWGRVTDFRSSVIVMTTNLGTPRGSSLGFGGEPAGRAEAEIRAFFRPEFFNRIDQVVTFRPLDAAAIEGIVRRELSLLTEREGLRRRAIGLEATPAAVAWLAREGCDPVYGARPLQRLIERAVVGPVARRLLVRPLPRSLRIDIAAAGLSVRET